MIGAWLLAVAVSGELEGIVLDADGLPIEDVLVVAYDHRLKYELDYTSATGSFRIPDLRESERRIRLISPDEANAIETYHDLAVDLCDAVSVQVPETGTVDLGTLTMPAGGVIFGVVLLPDGAPAEGLDITARPSGISPIALPRTGVSDQDGYFEIRGVPLQADGPLWNLEVQGDGIPEQYLGGAFLSEEAEVFSVASGTPTDAEVHTLLPGATLRGTVTGTNGPVTDGEAFAYSTGRTVSAPITDGTFELVGLEPGEAQLWVEAPGLGTTWYGDAPAPSATIPVTDGQVLEDLEIRLPAESVLRGVFTAVQDFGNSDLTLVNSERTVSVRAEVAPDGSFEVRQLSAGDWSIEIDPDDDLDLVRGPLLTVDGNLWEIPVSAGEIVELGDVPVPRGAIVEGTVLDRNDDDRVYGAWVYVENATTGTTRLVQSGRAGKFKAAGLPAGVYRMRVEYTPYCDQDPDWVTRHYPDQRNGVLGGSIPLAPGQVARWEPRVPRDRDHDGMGDGWEGDFGLDADLDDGLADLDGDGFVNLDEYLLGTNPALAGDGGCGAGGRGGNWLWLWIPGLLAWFSRRRG